MGSYQTGLSAACRFYFHAGKTGLIYDLDSFVWDRVCQDLRRWNEQGIRQSVSVNLSRCDVREDRDLAGHFQNLIRTYGLTPDQLRIEITETAYAENPDLLISTTETLRVRIQG